MKLLMHFIDSFAINHCPFSTKLPAAFRIFYRVNNLRPLHSADCIYIFLRILLCGNIDSFIRPMIAQIAKVDRRVNTSSFPEKSPYHFESSVLICTLSPPSIFKGQNLCGAIIIQSNISFKCFIGFCLIPAIYQTPH